MAAANPISFNAARAPCAVCGAEGQPCGRCRLDYYCCTEHQRQDFPRHKRGCGALRERLDPRFGRVLVANKTIPAGTVLLREQPLIRLSPPSPQREGEVFCVGCSRSLDLVSSRRCKDCGCPVCNKHCSSDERHRPECEAFQQAKYKLPNDELAGPPGSVLVWRALSTFRYYTASQKEPLLCGLRNDFPVDPAALEEMPGLKDLLQEQRTPWLNTAFWLREVAGLRWLPADGLVRAAGALCINAFQFVFEVNPGKGEMRGSAVYSAASLLTHSCAPNCISFTASDAGREHRLVAVKEVLRGQDLTVDFTEKPLRSKVFRRSALLRHWGLYCRCERCEDPADQRLTFSNLYCAHCRDEGRRSLAVSEHVCDELRCRDCGRVQSAGWVEETTEALKRQLDAVSYEVRGGRRLVAGTDVFEAFIARHLWPAGLLHPMHWLVLDAKQSLILAVRQLAADGKGCPPVATLDGWETTCRVLLRTLDAAKQGGSVARFSALSALYEIYHWRQEHQVRAIWAQGRDLELQESAPVVMEVVRMVKEMEPMTPLNSQVKELVDIYKKKLVALAAVNPLYKDMVPF